MARIEIVSASAGSGKTYRLAEVLAEAVIRGQARPEAVIATTFTRKAAAELRERVRARLLDDHDGLSVADRMSACQRLEAARIGTVHSVCGALVTQYALDLGLSPALRVLDEKASERLLGRALSRAVTSEQRRTLIDVQARLPELEWEAAVESVLKLARANAIRPAELASSATRSIEGFRALLQPVARSVDHDTLLREACNAFLQSVDLDTDSTKKTREYVGFVRQVLRAHDSPRGASWWQWMQAAGSSPARDSKLMAAPIVEAASRYPAHPRMHADVELGIRTVFEVAEAAFAEFESAKKHAGVIDFADQEAFALRLLSRPSVRDRLREETDLVLVDEFQDTNPIQLAIFFELAELAKRSVWVGDQKQSIFGFRGTDPTLMDAALQTILGDDEPDTLQYSWRSRPELVRLTSDVFAPAFLRQGIPEVRTRLEPAKDAEPKGLGPCVERWHLSGNKELRTAGLASAVRDMLSDPRGKIRDPVGGRATDVRPGDIAVLCLYNETCAAVAAELEALGVRAVRPRTGVLQTPEGHAAQAALALWVDPSDVLARVTLERLFNYGAAASAWLDRILAEPGYKAFASSELAQRVSDARAASPHAGPVVALQLAMRALSLSEQCARWGDATQRIANLDAIRSLAVAYAESSQAFGEACSPAGLLAYIEEHGGVEDDRAVVAGRDEGVVVSTWHAAKGLEWPIVVLFETETDKTDTPYGVRIVGREGGIKADAPLKGRWIRFWPWASIPKKYDVGPMKKRFDECTATLAAARRTEEEALRLLYVGWTRARDRVVLASKSGTLADGLLTNLRDEHGPLLCEPDAVSARCVSWGRRDVSLIVREGVLAQGSQLAPAPGSVPPCGGPSDAHVPAIVLPSSLLPIAAGRPPKTIVHDLGSRPPLKKKRGIDAEDLGNALHAFFAADRSTMSERERLLLATCVLERWRVVDALEPGGLVAASNQFGAWVAARWPTAVWRRECPVQQRIKGGTVVRGAIDLALETPDDLVVVDHKSFVGNRDETAKQALAYAQQVGAYAAALGAAADRTVTLSCVSFPLAGLIVELGR